MKIASSLLAATAFAQTCDVGPEITALFQGCVAVVTSSAFDDKHPDTSVAQFHSKWVAKCGKQSTRLQRIYARCGQCLPGYVVQFTENPETEPCAAVTELADQNIDWLVAHVTSPKCAARVAKVSLTVNYPIIGFLCPRLIKKQYKL